jgi:hypothetical protein
VTGSHGIAKFWPSGLRRLRREYDVSRHPAIIFDKALHARREVEARFTSNSRPVRLRARILKVK